MQGWTIFFLELLFLLWGGDGQCCRLSLTPVVRLCGRCAVIEADVELGKKIREAVSGTVAPVIAEKAAPHLKPIVDILGEPVSVPESCEPLLCCG